jgi:hypothetical protein
MGHIGETALSETAIEPINSSLTVNAYKHFGAGAPFYDDFDSTKNYMRIMHKHTRAVQARELTQAQTILQNQISAMGSYMWKNGAAVNGGRISVSTNQPYLVCNEYDIQGYKVDMLSFIGKTFIGQSSGRSIYCVNVDSSRRVYFSYMGGDIADGENFVSTTTPYRYFSMIPGSLGQAMSAANTAGIIFINGYFINVLSYNLSIIGWKDTEWNIGYLLTEEFVDSGDDITLCDPAKGSYNYNAVGADRLKISAELIAFRPDDETVSADVKNHFILGLIVKDGVVTQGQDFFSGSALNDVLAKRTYDESGSYSVHPWVVVPKESSSPLTHYTAAIQPGDGYIYGYYVQNLVSANIEVPKAQTTKQKDYKALYIGDGTYTVAANDPSTGAIEASYMLKFAEFEAVECMTEKAGAGNVIGECNVCGYNTMAGKTLIFLKNTSGVGTVFTSVKSLRSKSDHGRWINTELGLESGRAGLWGTDVPQVIDTRTWMIESVDTSSISYNIVKEYSVRSEVSGNTIVVSDTSDKIDFGTDGSVMVCYETVTGVNINARKISISPDNFSGTSVATLSSPDIKNNTSYTVVLEVLVRNVSSRTKYMQEGMLYFTQPPYNSMDPNFSYADEVEFPNADIIDIKSVTQTNNIIHNGTEEIKHLLELDTGQRDSFYENGKIGGFASEAVLGNRATASTATTYAVVYRYFVHGGFGPFTVSSYMTNNNVKVYGDKDGLYKAIPTYRASNGNTYNLRDCLDFRIKKSELGGNPMLFPTINEEILFKCSVYLPRIDLAWVSKDGKFGVTEGIPSENPEVPETRAGTMNIALLIAGAYTGNVSDVIVRHFENQRYTMSDIGKIAKNVENLQYAVALNQLELIALETPILDQDGLNLYKTGLFTDNLQNYNNMLLTDENFSCSLDFTDNSLIPANRQEMFEFEFSEPESPNVAKMRSTICLPWAKVLYTKNTACSKIVNVQDMMFYKWIGSCTLTPSIDTWVTDLGEKIIDRKYTETAAPVTISYTSSTSSSTSTSKSQWMYGGWDNGRHGTYEDTYTTVTTTVTTSSITVNYAGSWTLQSKTSQNYAVADEVMRQREVQYDVKGFVPLMEVDGYIDDVPLQLSNRVTDGIGNLSGTFMIPPDIPTGTKLVEFYDEAEKNYACADYKATGTIIWVESVERYIRTWTAIGTTTRVVGSTSSSSTTKSTVKISSYDPVAQSFYVQEPEGVFIESVDIFFQAKDPQLPVEAYIVEMQNGYPTNMGLPYAGALLTPAEVNISDDCSVATNFKFSDPVYLYGETEYAIVVLSASYSYTVFVSSLGDTDLRTGVGIFEQPHLGSFFKSQNLRTWTAFQDTDLTFNLYKCAFTANKYYPAIFNIKVPEETYEVVRCVLKSNVFTVPETEVTFHSIWPDQSAYSQYENGQEHLFTDMKYIYSTSDADYTGFNLKIRINMMTNSENVTPQIDIEQTYGIFINYLLGENTEAQDRLPDGSPVVDWVAWPVYCGAYVSKPTTLSYESSGLKVIYDAKLPNDARIEAYFKTNPYQPNYVEQEESVDSGSVGWGADGITEHVGENWQIYYYNADDEVLEPKSELILSGYDPETRRVYIRSVSDISDLKDATNVPNNYDGLDAKYTYILILPVISEYDIPCENWTAKLFYIGQYVFYGGSVWRATALALPNYLPQVPSLVWEKIPVLKLNSTVKQEEAITWRHMERAGVTEDINRRTNYVEYNCTPTQDIESNFKTFSIMLKMFSKDKCNVPKIKNIRAIATI